MANFFNDLLTQISTGDTVKDWKHATRLFVDNLYRLSPKYTFLFHVFIDINPTASAMTGRIDPTQQVELGMLAKSVSLPKYTIKNKVYNSYNRKNIVQDAVQYDPISISFHDDSADVVRGFWGDYYSYYFRDGDYPETAYTQDYKYQQRQYQNWGYSPKESVPYITAIRIYSLHQKYFSAYSLINPMITAFKHGDHVQGQNDLMQHEMTVAYEGVQYLSGPVSGGYVDGFDVIHYDRSPSPLTPYGGGTTSLLGPGGMMDSANNVLNNLSQGNFLTAAIIGARTSTNFNNANFGQVATAELSQIGMNVLKGQNQQATVFAPTASSIVSGMSTATVSVPRASTLNFGSIVNINNQNSI